MQSANKAQFDNALFSAPHDGLVEITRPSTKRVLNDGESIMLHPEKLLWIDTDKSIAILSAFLLPKFNRTEFSGRLALGFRLGQTKRSREYVIAPFDDSGHLGHITPIHNPIQRVIFGKSGLLHKAFHMGTRSHFISQTPDNHESIRGVIGQVGDYTSDRHLEIGFERDSIEIKSTSPYGTYAITP